MGDASRRCLQCESTEFRREQLSLKGSAWPVMFGSRLFQKTSLNAYACKECGFVSLYLGDEVEEADATD